MALLACFLSIGQAFGLTTTLGRQFPLAAFSFAILFLPYCLFGFGLANSLIRVLNRTWKRLAFAVSLLAPYLLFVLPSGAFRWPMFAGLVATVLAIVGVLEHGRAASIPDWHDLAALVLLAVAVESPFFRDAWPIPGLSGFPKLLFVNAGLFGFLVVRPVGGVGFTLQISVRDFLVGFREFLFFFPIAFALGFALQFLHYHAAGLALGRFTAAWLFTLFFVAIPEEIFFRGLILNLLERKMGATRALIATALLFGLAHFPKRAAFNWRYVILAALAGIFYGRAWLDRRRVITSGITHATVDAVWSIWLR